MVEKGTNNLYNLDPWHGPDPNGGDGYVFGERVIGEVEPIPECNEALKPAPVSPDET